MVTETRSTPRFQHQPLSSPLPSSKRNITTHHNHGTTKLLPARHDPPLHRLRCPKIPTSATHPPDPPRKPNRSPPTHPHLLSKPRRGPDSLPIPHRPPHLPNQH